MKINYTAFNGSTSYLANAKRLQTVAGKNISCFSVFTPRCFPFRETLYLLMSAILLGGNCFFISGTFVSNVAGILDGSSGACLYISLTHFTRASTFSENRLIHVSLFRVTTTTFSSRGRSFRLQNHEGYFFHEVLCFDTLWAPPRMWTSHISFGKISKTYLSSNTP